jgi:hypothetical protein
MLMVARPVFILCADECDEKYLLISDFVQVAIVHVLLVIRLLHHQNRSSISWSEWSVITCTICMYTTTADWRSLSSNDSIGDEDPKKRKEIAIGIVHFFSSVACVWVGGAKITGPIAKKISMKLSDYYFFMPIYRCAKFRWKISQNKI